MSAAEEFALLSVLHTRGCVSVVARAGARGGGRVLLHLPAALYSPPVAVYTLVHAAAVVARSLGYALCLSDAASWWLTVPAPLGVHAEEVHGTFDRRSGKAYHLRYCPQRLRWLVPSKPITCPPGH